MTKDLRDELKAYLAIDKDALDECLMQQPEVYSKVAEALAIAESERDATKLELEERSAEVDRQVRAAAERAEEKVTEAAIKGRVSLDVEIKRLNRELLDFASEAKLWRALESAFEQRADMLKKLVDLHLRSTYGYSLEAGVGQARTSLVSDVAERNRAAVSEARRSKKG